MVTEFPLNDQEVLLRHLHTTAREYVADHHNGNDSRPPRSRSPRRREGRDRHADVARSNSPTSNPSPTGRSPSEGDRYAKRLASTMDELQAFYDAAFPRLEEGADYLKGVQLDGITDEDRHLLWLFSSLVTVSFPVEVWRQPRVPESGASSFDAVIEPAI